MGKRHGWGPTCRLRTALVVLGSAVFAMACGAQMGSDAGLDAAGARDGGPDAGGMDAGLPGDDGGPGDSGPDAEDAGTDGGGGFDGGPDFDAGTDAGGGTDAGADAGIDAGLDAGTDAGFDAGFDAGMDAGFDAGTDAGFDAGRDAGFDAGRDAGTDAGSDAGLMDHSGTYSRTITGVIDPCVHRPFTGDPPATLTITRLGPGMYRITGAAPWVTLTGTINETTGAANLSGTGTVAGFSGVTCTFMGTITGGMLMGQVVWGAGNELPSCPGTTDYSIKFNITATRT